MKRIVMSVAICVGAAILVFWWTGCMNTNSEPVTGAQYFDLRPSQVDESRRMAESGDKDAAFRLYLYYGSVACDRARSDFWLRKAADMGHILAKQHLEVEAATKEFPKADGDSGAPGPNPFE